MEQREILEITLKFLTVAVFHMCTTEAVHAVAKSHQEHLHDQSKKILIRETRLNRAKLSALRFAHLSTSPALPITLCYEPAY